MYAATVYVVRVCVREHYECFPASTIILTKKKFNGIESGKGQFVQEEQNDYKFNRIRGENSTNESAVVHYGMRDFSNLPFLAHVLNITAQRFVKRCRQFSRTVGRLSNSV